MEKPEAYNYWCESKMGSQRLFEACWRVYRNLLSEGAINASNNQEEVMQWLWDIASEKVNNPRSSFYIHGK